ncbi:hypothetical protein ACFSO0_03675 [Brevibacillus sp. GCM10020057]|uniref:hypothetical protein n=1 Tax=Brevibacillus sp. GCM10020057 TaxID=3317327 RepID=UPI003644C5C1
MTTGRLVQIVGFYAVLTVALYLVNIVWINKLFGGAFLAERLAEWGACLALASCTLFSTT